MAQSQTSLPATRPWLEEWEPLSDPSQSGGQGETFQVKRKSDDRRAILKKLRKQESLQARGRMFREVANLRVLHQAGCKVPEPLGGNTDQFEQLGIELYFVMEYIDGPTLLALLSDKGTLSLAESIKLVLDIAGTMKTAHDADVIHRDLKPANIVVRSLADGDAVVVDYGLSFNRADPVKLTRPSESLDNEFLSLPERRVDGGDRRDPRSDLTDLCGILYYCLTGKNPRDLRDADDKPPHRRPGGSIRDTVPDASQAQVIEALLDRGFMQSIDSRFQTIKDLTARLTEIRHGRTQVVVEVPMDVAARLTDELLRRDRKTQIATLGPACEPILAILRTTATAQKLAPFQLNQFNPQGDLVDGAPGESLDLSWGYSVFNEANPTVDGEGAAYQVRAHEMECVLYRAHLLQIRSAGRKPQLQKNGPWELVVRFHGLAELPDDELIRSDLHQSLNLALGVVQTRILNG